MSTPTIRAALERLIEALNDYDPKFDAFPEDILAAARAALAAERAGGPSDEELTLTYALAVAAAVGGKRGPFSPKDAERAQLAGLRAVLAHWGRPAAPPAPLEGEVGELVAWLHGQDGGREKRAIHSRIATLLEQLAAATPAVVPVPVSERLPEPEDCDAEGRCWWSAPETDEKWGNWCLAWGSRLPPEDFGATHWLPFHALPLPAPQGGEVEP